MVDLFGTDVSGGARAVLDDNGLAPFARQPVGDNPRNRVGGSSGRKWNDDFDGSVRVITGQHRPVTMRDEGQKQCQDGQSTAGGKQRSCRGRALKSSRRRFSAYRRRWPRLGFAAKKVI